VDENLDSITVSHNTACHAESGNYGSVFCATCAKTVARFNDVPDRHSFNGVDCENCGILVETCFKSSHPYNNGSDLTWTMYQDGAKAMEVTFSEETFMEDGYDFITLYHADGTEIGTYTGAQLAGQTVLVKGDRMMLHMESDNSFNEYGFDVVSVVPVETAFIPGDINGDNAVDMLDAFSVFSAASTGVVTEEHLSFADMNGDGIIDMMDAFAIYRIASGA